MRTIGAFLAYFVLATSTATGGADTITVPLRWCVVEGSPALTQPACAGLNTTKQVIWRRMGRTASAHYGPFCNMSVQEAMTSNQQSYIVLPDPCDPTVNASCAGQKGDIVYSSPEHFTLWNQCGWAWGQPYVPVVGPLVVNIRRFVDASGALLNVVGATSSPYFCDSDLQASARMAVVDNDFTFDLGPQPPGCQPAIPQLSNDFTDQVLGHELGHALSLEHTVGQPETLMKAVLPTSDFLTSGGPGQLDIVCPDPVPVPQTQCGQLRLQSACHVTGATVDPPPITAIVPLLLGDASPEYVDLVQVGLVDDVSLAQASFFWEVGLFPREHSGVEFAFAIDLDSDPSTGGDPTVVGVDVPLPGTELAGELRVVVQTLPGESKTFQVQNQSLWRFSQGAFSSVPVLSSRAQEGVVASLQVGPPVFPSEMPFNTTVGMKFDRSLIEPSPGQAPLLVRWQASAVDPSIVALSLGRDIPPPADVSLVVPKLATCALSPDRAPVGETVRVSASGLAPNRPVEVLFDADVVATGATDGTGTARIDFSVPAGERAGTHAVSLATTDPGDFVTAHCSLTVTPDTAGAGGVSDLMVETATDGNLSLRWSPSCSPDDIEYEVYEGTLGAFDSHTSRFCATGGAMSLTFAPGAGDRYYLVVPSNGIQEGSYGLRTDGPRPPGSFACKVQDVAPCP